MINVRRLEISFDRPVIKDGAITVFDNELTVVFGDSGCGKTSLLYCLGLFSQDRSFEYIFDGNSINLHSDEELGLWKKRKIGFVFQEKNLFENLTLYENIVFNLRLAECEPDERRIDDLLAKVDLQEQKNKYPRQLSGGEQQRVAILCAVAKSPRLLIVDEPTSSLDNTNAAIIIQLLSDYARSGHMVIVSSHDNRIREAADRVYEIADKKVVEIEARAGALEITSNEEINCADLQKLNHPLNALRYYNRHNGGKKGIANWVMIIMCSLVIAFGGLLSSFGESYVNSQNEYLNRISDREMLVVNMTAPLDKVCDCDANISMTDEEVKKLHSIHHVVECYPYYEFKSYGFDCVKETYISGGNITVQCDDKTKETVFEGLGSDAYIMRPYYNEKDLSKAAKVEYDNVDEGIYLSSVLAERLGLRGNEKKVSITVDFCVPVGIETAEMKINNSKQAILTDTAVYAHRRYTFTVNGILDDSVQNTYSIEPMNSMYMKYAYFDNMLKESHTIFERESTYSCNPLCASAYVLYVDDYSMIANVKESVQIINPNFRIQSNYQDVLSMQEMIQNAEKTMKSVFWLVLLCIFVMMGIIQMNRVVARKYEIALLRADGLSNRELRILTCIEAIESATIIIIMSTLFAWIYSNISYLSSGVLVFELTVRVVLTIAVLGVLATSIPTLITVICFQKYQPATVMRNK